MELHHLRTFVVVAEEQNITRAAKRLFMTPPAVSAHIKALEEELNVTLFLRTPHGMQITEKGMLLKAKADQTLWSAQDLVNCATQIHDYLMGRLAIGINASPSLLRIAPLVLRMREECPGIELTFTSSVSGAILDSLQGGALDAGFIFGDSPTDAVFAWTLAPVELVIAAPKTWEARMAQAPWDDLAQLPWISSSGYCPFQDIVDALFRERHLSYPRVTQADDTQTKCELVSAGIGLALLERDEAEAAAHAGKLVIWRHPAVSSVWCNLSLAMLKTRQDDPLLMALKSKILALWQPLPDDAANV